MQITELQAPTNGGTLYVGKASSTRGRRYIFYATFSGEVGGVFRENPAQASPDGRCFWSQIEAPPALKKVAREAARKAVRA